MNTLNNAFAKITGGDFVRSHGTCEQHGEFLTFARAGMQPDCPRCIDERAKAEAREKSFERRKNALRSAVQLPKRFESSGLMEWIPTCREAELVKSSIHNYLKNIIDNPRQWKPLILTGERGTGKTHLACALAKNLIEYGVSVRYTTTRAMLADIKSAYNDTTKTEAGMIGIYAHTFDLLIIDEADIGQKTDNDKTLLFDVINGRYNDLRPVVIVSNQEPLSLADHLTERVIDRLQENAITLRCGWASVRATA